MTTYLIVAGFILLYAFAWGRESRKRSLSHVQRHWRFLVVFGVAVLPIAITHVFLSESKQLSHEQEIRLAKTNGNGWDVQEAYRRQAEENSEDITAQIDYIDRFMYHGYVSPQILLREFAGRYESELANLYLAYISVTGLKLSPNLPELYSIEDKDQPLYNFVLGVFHYYNSDPDSSEYYLKREAKLEPLRANSYVYLRRLYDETDTKKLDELLSSWELFPYTNDAFAKEYYYQERKPFHYIASLYFQVYKDTHWFTFFAAFLVISIWLIYLRFVDVFQPERWQNILMVFALSAATCELCLFFYDWFEHNTDLALQNSAWGDFWYSSIVIGGSEETIKLLPWVAFILLSRKAKEPYDYILYASVSALGFAFAENLMYYERHSMMVISSRSVMAAVGHMFFSSIIAYSVILFKYRYNKMLWKWALPIAGFALACLSHGFYDYWLISKWGRQYYILTFVFFILSLHIWHTFKNNAINNSTFFTKGVQPDNDKITFFLLTGFFGILMFEHVVLSASFGTKWSDELLTQPAIMTGFFGLYTITTFGNYRIQRGVWNRIKLPQFFSFTRNFTPKNFTGTKLRLFAPKTNPYIGSQLPITGTCIKKITVSGDDNWYIFKIDQDVVFPQALNDRIIIRHKIEGQDLDMDKVAIYFMLIPHEEVLNLPDLQTADLRYTDRAYSRPI